MIGVSRYRLTRDFRCTVELPPLGQRTYVDHPDPAAAVYEMGKEVDPHMIKVEEVIGEGKQFKKLSLMNK